MPAVPDLRFEAFTVHLRTLWTAIGMRCFFSYRHRIIISVEWSNIVSTTGTSSFPWFQILEPKVKGTMHWVTLVGVSTGLYYYDCKPVHLYTKYNK